MAMQQNRLIRADYQDNAQTRVPIPRQHFGHRFRFKVTKGAFVGGSSPAWVASAGNKLLKRIELVLTIEKAGQLTKTNISMENLRRLNLLQYKDQLASEGYAYLDLGRLPFHAMVSAELMLTWGALSALTTGAPTSTTGTYVDITRLEELNVGQPIGGMPAVLHKSNTLQANSVLEVKGDLRSGNILPTVLVVPSSSTLIQSVTVVQDGVKYHLTAEQWADLREENKADFELGGVQSDFGVIHFDRFGDGSQALRTGDMSTLEVIFVTAAEANATIELVMVEVVPAAA